MADLLVALTHELAPKYTSVVASIIDHFIHIDPETVTCGQEFQLDPSRGIRCHEIDCTIPVDHLRIGDQVNFEILEDSNVSGPYRAVRMSSNQRLPAPITEMGHLYLPKSVQAHQRAKEIPPEQVAKAEALEPFGSIARVARASEVVQSQMGSLPVDQILGKLSHYLARQFPGLDAVGISYELTGNYDEQAENRLITDTIKTYRELGFASQIQMLQQAHQKVKVVRQLIMTLRDQGLLEAGWLPYQTIQLLVQYLSAETLDRTVQDRLVESLQFLQQHNLLSDVTLLPMELIVDLLVTAPVWFFDGQKGMRKKKDDRADEDNPDNPTVRRKVTQFFCGLMPTQEFADLFQAYNYRIRSFATYQGDMIPRQLYKVMVGARSVFDYVVIATPYHDLAGKEWKDFRWVRNIDPFLIGFIEGVPFMYFLGRWSDTGLFPLVTDMIADTIAHLDAFGERLNNYKDAPWYHQKILRVDTWASSRPDTNWYETANRRSLSQFAKKLVKGFEQGTLFEVLRGQ